MCAFKNEHIKSPSLQPVLLLPQTSLIVFLTKAYWKSAEQKEKQSSQGEKTREK